MVRPHEEAQRRSAHVRAVTCSQLGLLVAQQWSSLVNHFRNVVG
jgi:hypothetical protein